MNCYIAVLGISESYEICLKKDISYTCTTQLHKEQTKNDDEHPKRNPSKTNQRIAGRYRASDVEG